MFIPDKNGSKTKSVNHHECIRKEYISHPQPSPKLQNRTHAYHSPTREMSNLQSTPRRTSRFIEGPIDLIHPQPPNELLFSILSQMDEFEKQRQHSASRSSSAASWGSSGSGKGSATRVNSAGSQSGKAVGIKGRLRALVKKGGV
jgi:hypothetical protein